MATETKINDKEGDIMRTKFRRTVFCILSIAVFLFQTAYAYDVKSPSALRNADIEALAAQPKFDGREYGIVTPVRDQGNTSLCWAYASANASETSILRKGIDPKVTARACFLSPQQIGYAKYNRGSDPLGNTKGETTSQGDEWKTSNGGTNYVAGLLSTWCGPVAATLPYDINGWEYAAYKLENAIAVDGSKLADHAEEREKMKRAIVKYGAVTFSYMYATETERYNPNNVTGGTQHACTVIGWDDTLPAESFVPGGAKLDGGWLIKNSYHSLEYFYLSYDVTCRQASYAFDYAENGKYDYNYFYDAKPEDFGVGSMRKLTKAANVFEAKNGTEEKKEQIKAVSVGISGENTICTVKIYTNVRDKEFDPRELSAAASKTVCFEYGGFRCIELDKPVEIENGSSFAVVAEVQNGYITLNESKGKSYAYRGYWTPIDAAVRIKAFTKTENKSYYVEFISESQVKAVAESGLRQLVLAHYEDGILKDIRIEPVNFELVKEKILPLPSEWKRTENTVYKAFLWESLNSLNPLCNVAEF